MEHELASANDSPLKHEMLAGEIREKILSGSLKVGTRLRSDSELAEHYGINKRTVARGMAALVREGLISRAPKRGSLVINTVPGGLKRSNAVGVICPNEGHVYGEMAQIINAGLLEHGLYPVWINSTVFLTDVFSPDKNSQLNLVISHLLAGYPAGLIIDADRFVQLDIIKENLTAAGNLIFLLHYLHQERLPGSYFLIDYERIGYLMAEELAKFGHRRLGFLTAPQPWRSDQYHASVHDIINKAIRDFCIVNGLEFIDECSDRCFAGEPVEQIIADLKRRDRLPTGVGAHSDSFFHTTILPALTRLQLAVPRDISVIGMGNTPWCDEAEPHLSSISYSHRTIARLGVAQIAESESSDVLIPPVFVARTSVTAPYTKR